MIVIEKIVEYLQEWLVRYVKNRDLIFRRIEDIKEGEGRVTVKLKQGKQQIYIIAPSIVDIESVLDEIKGDEMPFIVTYNTQANFDVLLKNWDRFLEFSRHLSLFFVNPFSKLEKRWIVYPQTHEQVSEKEGLKNGLLSLFSTVDKITEEKIKEIIK